MALWMLVSFAFLVHNTGSSAEDTVFVAIGASAQLDIQTHEQPAQFKEFNWMKDRTTIIVSYTRATKQVELNPVYKDRVDFNNETFSLTLKNMQKTDRGVYTAKAKQNFEEKIINESRVSVIDAVETPVLTLNSIWSSTEPCNFTCTADNLTIINYYNSSCFDNVKSSGIYSLSLKCTDEFIICNHSNPVSWKYNTKTVKQFCNFKPDKGTPREGFVLHHWLIPLICLSLCLFVVVAGFCFYKKKKGKEPDVTTPTSQTTPDPDSINQNPSATKSKTDNPSTVYSTVHNHPIPPTTESDQTIYAVVNKPSAVYESVH